MAAGHWVGSGRWERVGEIPWYPPLLVAAQIAAIYVDNSMSVVAIFRPLFLFLALAVALTVLWGLVAGSLQRGGVAAAVSLLFLRAGDVVGNVTTIVVALGVVAAAAVILRWARVERPIAQATRALNTMSVILMLVVLAQLVVAGRIPDIVSDLHHGMSLSDLEAREVEAGSADPARPDVYVVMLDGYPRRDTLERFFDFDNGGFLDDLAARGFAVAEHNRSNYMYTALTLATMLNMRHIDDLPDAKEMDDLRLLINDNAVFDEFRRRGYLVVSTASGWESEAMRNADVFCGDELINDFELNLVGSSLAGRLLEIAAPTLVADRDRNSVNGALDCIVHVADVQLDQPRFMFAHVPSPHLPIVFSRDGSPASPLLYGHTVQELPVAEAEFANGYTQQLEYLNQRVLSAIDEIVAKSTTPPIVVLFSDHGSESHLNWDNALLSDLEERFSNLFAASTPGADDLFGDAPTPVNVFPQLLNRYFGASIPLTHDGSFASTVQDRLGLTPYSLPAGQDRR